MFRRTCNAKSSNCVLQNFIGLLSFSAINGILATLCKTRFQTLSGVLKIIAVPFLFFGAFILFGRGGIEERNSDSKGSMN